MAEPTAIDTKVTLNTAVTEAAEALETPENDVVIDDETPAPESEDGDDDTSEGDLSEDGQKEAVRLYRALMGPQSKAVLAALAQNAGLLGQNAPETKTEVREAKKEIKSILEDALGSEYKFLSDKLDKALTGIFEQERKEQESRFVEIQARQVEREVVDTTKQLNADTKGDYAKYEERIAELSKEIQPGDMNVKTYLNRLYTIAKSEGTKSTTKQVVDRINRNRTDANGRLRTTAVPAPAESKVPDKKMTLNESIAFAMEELTKGKR